MSRKKNQDPVYSSIYGPFRGNPAGNRLSIQERMYIRILTELSVNRFKWIGLPDSVDQRFIELTLFNQALCIFYFEKKYDRYLAVRGAGTGPINVYDNPTRFQVLGNPHLHRTLTAKQCVPIWGNFLRIPDQDIVFTYAERLARIDRTFDNNIDAMRISTVLTVPENQRLTYVNLMRQHKEGQPVILGNESLDMNNIQAFQVGPEKEQISHVQIAKQKVWNEAMTLLGINNANQDKKERLVSDEVDANNEQVVSSRGIALNSRQLAAEQINRRYKLSIDVGWNGQVDAMAGQYTSGGMTL